MTGDDDTLWVGIDTGTQSTKAVVVGDSGRVYGSGRSRLHSRRDGGRHEQDPLAWIRSVADALRQALEPLTAPQRQRLAGVAHCTTSGTLAVLGADDEPVGPGLMYDDDRGAAYAGLVQDAGADAWSRLGVTVQPSWAICRIAWLVAHDDLPEGTRIAHQGDVVAAAMTGTRVATDWTSALKSGYDTVTLTWPTAVFDAIDGLGRHAAPTIRALPAVVPPGSLIGHTSAAWHEATGLPTGTPLFAGMTDGCAAQLGAGALRLGDWHSVVGTTLVLKGVADHPVSVGAGAVYSHRAPYGDVWLPGGASSAGTGAVSALFPHADLTAVDAAVRASGPPGVACYPLNGRGERFPFADARAEGFALWPDPRPLASLHALGDTEGVAALWTGVAFVERLCFDLLSRHGVRVDGRVSTSGGGTHSTAFTTVRASLLGRPIEVVDSADGSVGMAVLARWGAGRAGSATATPLADTAELMTGIRTTVEPDPALTERLHDGYRALVAELARRGWTDR